MRSRLRTQSCAPSPSACAFATTPRPMTRRLNTLALTGLSLVMGLALWEWAVRDISRVVFAPPSAVLTRLAMDIASGVLPLALLGSLATLAVGFLLAVALAMPLGFLIGR